MLFSRLTTHAAATGPSALRRLARELEAADAVIVGAGAGLSASAGYEYAGPRFERYFSDFRDALGMRDMYSGSFFPFADEGQRWAFWSRLIWLNRYAPIPGETYDLLRDLVAERDHFVLTTNVDHCFQRAGFDGRRLFYTQGDYGLWQCSRPCHDRTYDNRSQVREMLLCQGFTIAEDDGLLPPGDGSPLRMEVGDELVPRCPVCGEPMAMNLRADETFVEDEGWHRACGRYQDFLRRHEGTRLLLLELGVGGNTPGIIKYPFWQLAARGRHVTYACVNRGEACCPVEIADRSVLLDADITDVLRRLARG